MCDMMLMKQILLGQTIKTKIYLDLLYVIIIMEIICIYMEDLFFGTGTKNLILRDIFVANILYKALVCLLNASKERK